MCGRWSGCGLIEEMRPANPGLRAFAFLNRADARGNDNDGSGRLLKDANCISFIDTPLGARKAFSNAAAEGRAVTELKRKDAKAEAESGPCTTSAATLLTTLLLTLKDTLQVTLIPSLLPRRPFDDGHQRQTPETGLPLPCPTSERTGSADLIHKGGSVAKSSNASQRDAAKPMLVQLRLYPDLIEEIDSVPPKHRPRRRRPPSRHAWIVQAIEEKLARDRQTT